MLTNSAIVLLGHFNPAIFHPEWFNRFGVLPLQETQWAEGEKGKVHQIVQGEKTIVIEEVPPMLVAPDKADLNFLSLRVEVALARFVCSTGKREAFALIKETAIKTFQLLSHTPIRIVGINFEGHALFKEKSDVMLRNLFAKNSEAFEKAVGVDYKIGGMLKFLDDGCNITIKIEDSIKMEGGVYYHGNFSRLIATQNSEQAIQVIDTSYDSDLGKFTGIVCELLGGPEKVWLPA